MSFGSYKRFEQTGEISFDSLIKIAIAFGMENDFDEVAADYAALFSSDVSKGLDYLFVAGGSSGGARPKIMTEIDGVHWINKFPSSEDSKETGRQEYEYSRCAKACGIVMTEKKLFLAV